MTYSFCITVPAIECPQLIKKTVMLYLLQTEVKWCHPGAFINDFYDHQHTNPPSLLLTIQMYFPAMK